MVIESVPYRTPTIKIFPPWLAIDLFVQVDAHSTLANATLPTSNGNDVFDTRKSLGTCGWLK
ncbi:MAG: hypothetical protein ACI87W_001340 [Halieaceae bacterium]|jgi:hypothetical protein